MTKRTTFKAQGGADASGELSEPSGAEKAPGLVVVQEYWGVNDHVRSLVDRFAAAGFLALAPDLYQGTVTKNPDEAMKLMVGLDRDRALRDIAGAVELLRSHPRCNGKVGITGFCMGGAYSFSAACAVPGLSAVVPFYGVPDPSKVDYAKVTAPIQAHFAKTDQWATPASAEAVKKQLEARGQTMELHLYDAQHAFMNDTRPEVHDPALAKQAWERAVAFLKKNLS